MIADQPESISYGVDRLAMEPGHTLPDPCTYQHGRPRCDPAQFVVWMVSILPLVSNSSDPFTRETFLRETTTTGITLTFMFDSFFSTLARSKYFSVFLLSFILTLWFARTAKSINQKILFFLLLWLINSRSDFWLVHLVVWSCFSLLYIFSGSLSPPIGPRFVLVCCVFLFCD